MGFEGGRVWRSRREFLGLGAVAAALALTGCGGSNGAAGRTGPPAPGTGAYPVTVTDKFGTRRIEHAPPSIASVGRTDHDVLLALGIVPASVYRFVPAMTRGVGVWAEPALGGANPLVLTNPLNYEKIAALRPGLILAVQTTGDESEYRTLSRIAPTLGPPPHAAPNTVDWRESARAIATAVGRAADGDALVARTEATLAEARAAHPRFAGRSVTVLLCGGGQVSAYTPADTRMQVATALGLMPSRHVAGLDPARYSVPLSTELIDDADADVVLVLTTEGLSAPDTLAQYPILATSAAARGGRLAVVEDYNVSLAFSSASVLSIPYALRGLIPPLTRVLG